MKIKHVVALGLLGLLSTSCGDIVNPGEVYLKVKLTGPDAGIEKAEVINSGKAWAGIDEKLYQIDTKVQNYTWTKDTTESSSTDESMVFGTNDGVRVASDVAITYQITDAKAFLVAYKKEDEEFRGGELRNLVRDTLNTVGAKVPLRELINVDNSSKATSGIELVQSQVLSQLNDTLKSKGVVVSRIAFISGFRLPERIQAGLNAAQESAQAAAKAEQDLKKAIAELKVKQVEAQQAKVEAATLTPLLLKKLELENQSKMVEKWNGEPPQVINLGSSNTPTVFNSNK